MSEALPSLLPDDGQGALFLLPPAVTRAIQADGVYTAERFSRDHPERYHAVVRMVAAGMGPRPIDRTLKEAFGEGIDRRTIEAVARREQLAIPTVSEEIVSQLSLVVADGLGVVREKIASAKAGEAALATKLCFDMLQLATGGATMRVETVEAPSGPRTVTWDEWLDGMKRANMGSGGGEKVAKGAVVSGAAGGSGTEGELAAGGDRGPGAVHRLPVAEAFTDVESVISQKTAASDTAPATAHAAPERTLAGGGEATGEGGVSLPGGALAGPTHSTVTKFSARDASPPAPLSPNS